MGRTPNAVKAKKKATQKYRTGRFSQEEKGELGAIAVAFDDPEAQQALVEDFSKRFRRSEEQVIRHAEKVRKSVDKIARKVVAPIAAQHAQGTRVLEIKIRKMSIDNNVLRIEF